MDDHKPEPSFRGRQGTVCKHRDPETGEECGRIVARHRRGRYAGQWRHHAYPWGMIAHNRRTR